MIPLRSPDLDAVVAPHGARLARLSAPDRHGRRGEVVLGLSDAGYVVDGQFLGATVGRYANRIAGGSFVLDGRTHVLARNEPDATLHGGPAALDHAEWRADAVEPVPGGEAVTLHHTSPDGHNGFPGRLEIAVTYAVIGSDLAIDIHATTDAPTVVNLTNHAYFNLHGSGTVEDHEITVHADSYLPVDASLIPTGPPAGVADTPFDLRRPTRIGRHLRAAHPQLRVARGYDHCFVLGGGGPSGPPTKGLHTAAVVHEPTTGRTLTVLTDQPGLQFYSGNMLDGSTTLSDGRSVRQGDAFCLEPQHFPDSPNRDDFPSTVLRPGRTHRTRIVYRMGVRSQAAWD